MTVKFPRLDLREVRDAILDVPFEVRCRCQDRAVQAVLSWLVLAATTVGVLIALLGKPW